MRKNLFKDNYYALFFYQIWGFSYTNMIDHSSIFYLGSRNQSFIPGVFEITFSLKYREIHMLANFDKHCIKPFFRTTALRLFWWLSLDVSYCRLHSELRALLRNAKLRASSSYWYFILFYFVPFCFPEALKF